jgi:hypothetical protein
LQRTLPTCAVPPWRGLAGRQAKHIVIEIAIFLLVVAAVSVGSYYLDRA